MSCRVRIQSSGHEFVVETGEAILTAALRQGIALPYGCRTGCCGACIGTVLSGEVEYGNERPAALLEEERRAGKALLCVARARGDVVIAIAEDNDGEALPVRVLPAKIRHMERLNDEVMQLSLKLPEGSRLQYRAGQYVDFILKDGRRRSFSIANAPHGDALLQFHIRRVRGGRFTDQLFSDIHENELLRIEGPKGEFYLREHSDRPIIFLATGTGFGPIKAIIEHALAEGRITPMALYWGARHQADLYLHRLAQTWAKEHPHFRYVPVLSRPAAEDQWTGRTGYVQDTALADCADFTGSDVYACGHPQMVFAAKEALMARGLDPDHCYSDAFAWAKD